MIVPDVQAILDAYLEAKGASNKALIYRAEIKEALRCGDETVNAYLKELEPIRGGRPKYYSTQQVAKRILEMEVGSDEKRQDHV